ncbi:MAG: hypothetical protein IAG13_34105 [Deltaproteobacteria bacterium]|nr:hypothetical protein [Nannocystaceae bacterium]
MTETPPRPWLARTLLVAIAITWTLLGRGLVSSNDGSHLALARALVLRHETRIDPDVALTLWIDRAERDGHQYSDRPPGTAFLALPAVWLGAQLDPVLTAKTLEVGELVLTPAADRYAETYVARARKLGRAPTLVQFQGTALLLRIHCALVGVLGLWLLAAWLRARELSRNARAFAVITVAVATLWGPYSTTLFSHVTAGTMWCAVMLACARSRGDHPQRWLALAGAAGAWAVATDYLLIVPIALQLALTIPRRQWGWLALGAAPLVLATAAYHTAAFGTPWSIGYDHQAHFEFARTRGDTFAGNPLSGAWTLFGLGHGAGVLAQSPVLALAIAGACMTRRWRELAPLVPWLLLLCLHRSPFGGETLDHRYLVPAIPVLAPGLAVIWERWVTHGPRLASLHAFGLLLVGAISAVLVWSNFVAWQ